MNMDYAGWLLVVDMLEQEQIDPSRALRNTLKLTPSAVTDAPRGALAPAWTSEIAPRSGMVEGGGWLMDFILFLLGPKFGR